MLHRFTLKRNGRDNRWDLLDQTGEVIRTFQLKRDATAGGVLEPSAKRAAAFRIHKRDGIPRRGKKRSALARPTE